MCVSIGEYVLSITYYLKLGFFYMSYRLGISLTRLLSTDGGPVHNDVQNASCVRYFRHSNILHQYPASWYIHLFAFTIIVQTFRKILNISRQNKNNQAKDSWQFKEKGHYRQLSRRILNIYISFLDIKSRENYPYLYWVNIAKIWIF